MKSRIALLAALSFAAPAKAAGSAAEPFPATFKAYLEREASEHRFSFPDFEALRSNPESRAPKPLSDKPAFLALYKKSLGAERRALHWQAQELAPSFQMPNAQPPPLYYNTHLLWAVDAKGRRIAGFRPVDTSTGCNSGCSPVVFHLRIDAIGHVEGLIEEPKRPLEKTGHAPLSSEDKAGLLQLSQKLPEALALIDGTDLLADTAGKFPPQTWTPLKPLLVPGAAYTSFRVYEAALKTRDFVRRAFMPDPSDAGWLSLIDRQLRDKVLPLLKIQDLSEGSTGLERAAALIESEESPKAVRSAVLRIGAALGQWIGLQDSSPNGRLNAFFERPAFASSHLKLYCGFLRALLETEAGRKSLQSALDSPRRPHCPVEDEESLRLLSLALGAKGEDLEKAASAWDFSRRPPMILADPLLLHAYADAAAAAKKPEAGALRAEWLLRYPRAAAGLNMAVSTEERAAAESAYRAELRRSLLPQHREFPPQRVRRGKKWLRLPLKGKRLYVFFASWCPHCRSTIKAWAQGAIEPALWEQIQLVEAFHRDDERLLPDFCKATALPEKICASVVKLPEDAQEFVKRMALVGVPRLVVTDAKGRIAAFDFAAHGAEGSDFGRDLGWILQEAAQ